tara:strand:- start:1876 stop:2847 length:972 start_codon:yes stop_codon:yes gene_type:complete
MKQLLREGLLKHLRLNETIAGNCGTHYTKQFMFEEGEDFDPFGHIEQDTEVITEPIDTLDDCVLGFSNSNTKLEWPYFSLPAGYTCPMATVCKNFASKPGQKFSDGKSIKKGKEAEMLCYAARAQAQYKAVKEKVFKNMDLIMKANKEGGSEAMADLILKSLKYHGLDKEKLFRIHESGDFFNKEYMQAWIKVANTLPGTLFYAYTTSIPLWVANKGSIPSNLKLIASMDKNNAKSIIDNDLRYSLVVYSPEQAKELGLKIDVDDSLAWGSDESFALLLHGGQHAGSDAAEALKKNKKAGVYDKVKQAYKQNRQSKLDKLRKL